MALRTCQVCGLEAHTEEELRPFKTRQASRYGHENLCNDCHTTKERERHRGKPNFVSFKGKIIQLKENPRTNICHECKKTHPEDLKNKTHLHHIIYDDNNPLAWTIELCNSCHVKLHHALRHPEKSI